METQHPLTDRDEYDLRRAEHRDAKKIRDKAKRKQAMRDLREARELEFEHE